MPQRDIGGADGKPTLEAIKKALPAFAEDVRTNLDLVLEGEGSSLSDLQRWGVAVASAASVRSPRLLEAIRTKASEMVPEEVVEDALAAASIMAMNVVYYGFQHMVHKEVYATRSPMLRMQRMATPATTRLDFELFSLAVSAIHGCHPCVVGHEMAVTEGEQSLSPDQVHDAIRIAAVIHAAAISLDAL